MGTEKEKRDIDRLGLYVSIALGVIFVGILLWLFLSGDAIIG